MKQPEWIWVEAFWPRPLLRSTAEAFLEHLASDESLGPLALEARSSAGQTRTFIAARPTRIAAVEHVLSRLVDGVHVRRDRHPDDALDAAWRLRISGGELGLGVEKVEATVRSVLSALSVTDPDDTLVLQILLGRRLGPRLTTDLSKERYVNLWDALNGKTTPVAPEERARVRQKRAGHGFSAQVRLAARTNSKNRTRGLVAGLQGALRTLEGPGTRFGAVPIAASLVEGAEFGVEFRHGYPLSTGELVGFAGWPVGDGTLPGVPPEHPKLIPAPAMAATKDRVFARAAAPGQDVLLGIPAKDATTHSVFLGPTNSGKSTAMLRLIEADAAAGRSVLVIDPKGDLVRDVLARIPDGRLDDVVVVDPVDPSGLVVGLNPLQDGSRAPELVADSLLASLRSTFADSWGIRAESTLSAGLLALARIPGSTLLWLPRLLTDKPFRKRVLAGQHDPFGTDSFFAEYDALSPGAQGQLVGPALARLRQYLIRPAMRAVLGQAEPKFKLADLFDERKRPIVLISLNKGTLGESSRLLGSLVVGQLWPLILRRNALPPAQRHLVSIYIDEVQDYLALPTDLADAFSQARSLGVSFNAAHQYRGQLPEAMKAAFDANARNQVLFTLNGEDAREMAKLTTGIEPDDLMTLPRFHIYMNTMHDGHPSGWVSAITLPPSKPLRTPEDVRAMSAARYGRSVKETEAEALAALVQEPMPAPDSEPETFGRRPA